MLRHKTVNIFQSVWFENVNGKFLMHKLPEFAQLFPIFGIVSEDFTGNGFKDLLLTGNIFTSEVETGNADAGNGLLLEGNADKTFIAKTISESSFFAPLDAKDLDLLKSSNGMKIAIVSNNNRQLQVFAINPK